MPAGRFAALVSRSPVAGVLLPLAHSTDGYFFRQIMAAGQLEVQDCPVFEEKLLYFFYGRPAYVPSSTKKATSLSASSIVCFVIDSASEYLPIPRRIFPFDTGAMHGGLLASYFHPAMKLENFEVDRNLHEARRIVGLFYGDNENYWRGRPVAAGNFAALDMEAQGYYALIGALEQSDPDHRRGSIEAQFNTNIKLNRNTVMAVVMPEDFYDDPEILNYVKNELGAEPLHYPWHHAQPGYHTLLIMDRVRTYLRGKALLR